MVGVSEEVAGAYRGQDSMCSHRIWMGRPWLKPAAWRRWVSEGIKRGLNLPWDLSVSPPERLAGSLCISGRWFGADTGALWVREMCSVETPSEFFGIFWATCSPPLALHPLLGGGWAVEMLPTALLVTGYRKHTAWRRDHQAFGCFVRGTYSLWELFEASSYLPSLFFLAIPCFLEPF